MIKVVGGLGDGPIKRVNIVFHQWNYRTGGILWKVPKWNVVEAGDIKERNEASNSSEKIFKNPHVINFHDSIWFSFVQ